MVEKKAAANVAVDWAEYFQSIRTSCPWSLAAWRKQQISIEQWRGQPLPLEPFLARVYIVDLNPRRLKKLCARLDRESEQEEWLWSHPRYGGDSTPMPVLIQQNRTTLENIRKTLEIRPLSSDTNK